MKYRFQWTFPIVSSPHDSSVVYAAGNRVFRSTNEGGSWEPVSPDLTRNDPTKYGPAGGPITKDNTSVEYYGTVFAFAESPLQKGLLWAGSDDGLVHVSRDGGKTWMNVTPKDLPEWSMISQIDPSPHDAGTLFVAANRYKLDDRRPFLYQTTDFGQTWKRISDGLPKGAFTRVVRQDAVRKDLLYAGTELGAFVSLDGGARWQPLRMALPGTLSFDTKEDETRGRLPIVPITDLIVKGDDVVVSTQGRSFWILDDVSPLRQAAGAVTTGDAYLFKPGPAYRFGGPPGPRRGQNPPYGAVLYYWLKAEPKDKEEVTLEILDGAGKVVRKVSSKGDDVDAPPPDDDDGPPQPPAARKLPAKAGMNRFAWDLRHADATRFKNLIMWAGNTTGPRATPGAYQVRLTVGGKSQTQPLEVRKDPRLAATQADFEAQQALALQIRDKLTETNDAIVRIRSVRDQVATAADRAKAAGQGQKVQDAAEGLKKKLTAVEEALYQTKNRSNQDPLNYPIRLNNKLSQLTGVVNSADARPTDQTVQVYQDIAGKIDVELGRLREALDKDLAAFNALVRERQVPAVAVKEKKKDDAKPGQPMP
jgi:hypothetical protein